MKKLVLLGCLLYQTGICYATQVTHIDYTSGGTITASGQNANENAIVNAVNGNLDNTNITAGSLLGTNIANNTVTVTNLSTSLQSSMTVLNSVLGDQTLPSTPSVIAGNINNTFIGVGRNRVLNGEMLFDQKNESNDGNNNVYISTNTGAHYGLDQWRFEDTNATSVFTVKRSSETLPDSTTDHQFQYAMKVTVTTAAAVQSGDGVNMEYPMETYFMRDFRWGTPEAKSVTLSFWVLCNTAGTYSITLLQDNASNRSYVTTYTVQSNIWKHVIITVPGDTTTPQSNWPVIGDGQFGLKIVWDLGSGSSVTTSSTNQWLNSTVWKATGSNSLTSGFSVWYLTGVQLEIGSNATSFEYSSYIQQLHDLQRYFFKTLPQGTACAAVGGVKGALSYFAQNGGVHGNGVYFHFPTDMTGQNPATVNLYSPVVPGSVKWYNESQAAESGTAQVLNAGATGVLIANPQISSDALSERISVQMCVDERLGGP